MIVFSERYDRRDEGILEKFFGKTDEKKTRRKTIEGFDLDRLRPLAKYLKTATAATDPKNIELLAWLIDYKGRPYEYDKADIEPSIPGHSTPTGIHITEANLTVEIDKRAPTNRRKPDIVLTVTIVLAGIGLYLAVAKIFPTGPQACMFWSGDRYLPIRCSEASTTTPAIPINYEKIAHFRKITRPDTITENALGTIWYAKYHDSYECYTDSGFQLIDTNLKLQLLNDYVLLRYIRPGLQPTATLP